MGISLKVDTDELDAGINIIHSERGVYEEQYTSLFSATDNLHSSWSDESSSVFYNSVDSSRNIFSELNETLKGLEDDVRLVKQDFENAFQDVNSRLRSFYL